MTELTEVFSTCLKGSVALLGIGNRLRGDDGIGSLLAERLRGKVKGCVLDCGEVPENYTGQVKEARPRAIVLVDAVELGQEAGAIAAFRGRELSGPGRMSTHNPYLGVLAHYLEQETGAQVYLLGVQPKGTGFGEPMSREAARTLEVLEDVLASCLGDESGETTVREE
jgi:hydrogenase 3 maturation protease